MRPAGRWSLSSLLCRGRMWAEEGRWITVKLDTNCVRDVLLAVESLQRVFVNDDDDIEKEALWADDLYAALPQYDKAVVFYALYNLNQAGYIDLSVQWIESCVNMCAINHMTYKGHEFLESIRDSKQWTSVKKGLEAIRNYSLSAISSVAEGITSAAISSYLTQNN